MSFKRNDVQEFIEIQLGCYNVDLWPSFKSKLLLWEISQDEFKLLENCVDSDLTSYFCKAIETFSQAISDIHNNRYSWAIVKLYYSTFYLLRCDILFANYIIVRCGGLYFAKMQDGQKFIPFTSNKARGDHQLTIALAKKLYDNNEIIDPILGNSINGNNAYIWLLHNRERVNYQQKNFSEPLPDISVSHLIKYFSTNTVKDLFQFYNSKSDYSICFDVDHSMLAIPYKKLLQVYHKIGNRIQLKGKYKRKIISCIDMLDEFSLGKKEWKEILN